ncbi:MAG: nucleotidyltransferase domain-containing protein [Planctomycetaceae bacterium]
MWAQTRDDPFAKFAPVPSLQSAWAFSVRRWHCVRQALSTLPEDVACVAVSGSLSRMETHENSDLDVLVVIDDRERTVPATHLYERVWDQLRRHDELRLLKPPKPGGIFSRCVSWKALTDVTARGIVAEDITAYGQRMQLLLDSQPAAATGVFVELQVDLLNWYAETRVSEMFGEAGPFHWLWQDVQRYWRSIRARANWLHHDQADRSLEVNLKLRSSRLTLVAAFLLSIAETHRETRSLPEAVAFLCQQLTWTPLERLVVAMPGTQPARELLVSYETVWKSIANGEFADGRIPEPALAALACLRNCLSLLPRASEPDWWF